MKRSHRSRVSLSNLHLKHKHAETEFHCSGRYLIQRAGCRVCSGKYFVCSGKEFFWRENRQTLRTA